MIPGGFGYEVIKFEHETIREIAKLPADVRIMGALPDLAERHGHTPREWYRGMAPLRPVYILIAHRYCVRVPDGCPYQFTRIEEFLDRYKDLSLQEGQPLEPCDEHYAQPREAWHRGADGVAREYIWHPTGGWVRK